MLISINILRLFGRDCARKGAFSMQNKKHATNSLFKKGGPFLLALALIIGFIIMFRSDNHVSWSWYLYCMTDLLLFCVDMVWFRFAWNIALPLASRVQVVSVTDLDQIPLSLPTLLNLNPTEFEKFVGMVLEAMGMEYTQIKRIGGSGDLGADIYARNMFDLPIIVQCKRYAPDYSVDSPDMQRFLGSIVHYRAVYGWFITTSRYTQPALDFAAMHQDRIRLLDGDALVALLQQRQQEIAHVWKQRKIQGYIEVLDLLQSA